MRFIFLAGFVSLLWLTAGRAQEASGTRTDATKPKKTPQLPDMPAPKSPVQFARWRCWSCLHPKRERDKVTVQSSSGRAQASTWGMPDPVVDRKFWLVSGGTMGSSLLVTLGTNHCRHTVGVGRCIGSDGPFMETQGIQIALSGVVTGIGYWWKKSDQQTHEKHRRWWVFPSVAAAVNTIVAVDQFRKSCWHSTLLGGRTCK